MAGSRAPRAPLSVYLALTFADGSVGIMQFVTHEFQGDGSVRWSRPATPEAIQREIDRSSYDQPVTSWRPLDPSELPADRTWRNAWRDTGKAIQPDVEAAKPIFLARLRSARNEALTRLDADWMKATGQKDVAMADTVEAKRQALRDLPQVIDLSSAKTVRDLDTLWPTAALEETQSHGRSDKG